MRFVKIQMSNTGFTPLHTTLNYFFRRKIKTHPSLKSNFVDMIRLFVQFLSSAQSKYNNVENQLNFGEENDTNEANDIIVKNVPDTGAPRYVLKIFVA